MSDDDLRRVLRVAEASAVRMVEAPGADAVHRTLRRRRRRRAVVACLLAAAVISGSVAVFVARSQERVPPINQVTPSADPTTVPTEDASPTAQAAAALSGPPVTASSSPARPCTNNPIGIYLGGKSDQPIVGAADISGRDWPLCPGVTLKVTWVSYRLDPGTTTARKYKTGSTQLDSTHSRVTLTPENPPTCPWWLVYASNTVIPRQVLDVNNYHPGTQDSPYWDFARGRNAQVTNSSWQTCPTVGTPTP